MTKGERCKQLRQLGYSIGQIAKRLHLSESTVHWHVKGIRLTVAQRESLRLQKRELMVGVNAKRRGRALRQVAFRKPRWNGKLVELVAHLNFDGRIDRYGLHYYNNSKQQAEQVKSLVQRLLGIEARIRQRQTGLWIVSYYHVGVASWLLTREQELLTVIWHRPDWQRIWLQALFDDEGHVHFSGSVRRVRASQDSFMVLRRAQQFLKNMHIQSRIDSRAKAVEITGQENLSVFRKRISFSPGIFINENRRNGLWHKPLEKRTLLELALTSYGN